MDITTQLKFHKEKQNSEKSKQSRNIILLNPPFSRKVTTNVAKTFLNLLNISPNLTSSTKLLPETLSKWAITAQKAYPAPSDLTKKCDKWKETNKCKIKLQEISVCPLDSHYQQNDVIYKCIK